MDSSDYLIIPVDKTGKPDRDLLDTVLRPPTWPVTTTGKKFTFRVSLKVAQIFIGVLFVTRMWGL